MFSDFDAINVGDTKFLVKKITADDVRKFVDMTGDDNPLHVNRKFAETTSFKDIVVHGMLGASFISTVIGTKLPGSGALWVSQNIEFLQPVRLGDELTVTCTVIKKYDRERLLELETVITNQNQQKILTGTGKVKVLVSKTDSLETKKEIKKVAIVTGGAGGIGEAICLKLANDGYNIVINYVSKKEKAEQIADMINKTGKAKAIAVQADIASESGAEKLYKEAVNEFGGVSVLVNNASPRINPKPFLNTDWRDFQSHLDVQLKGAFLITKSCVPDMIANKFGRIINITSQVIEGQPSVTWTAYATAKASLAMMSRYLAAELGVHNITVNCISPGMTETSLIGDIPEKAQMIIARQTPLRRLAQPQDIAASVAYLISDEASFITGHTMQVNGGMVMK